jgi:hypothetical protein
VPHDTEPEETVEEEKPVIPTIYDADGKPVEVRGFRNKDEYRVGYMVSTVIADQNIQDGIQYLISQNNNKGEIEAGDLALTLSSAIVALYQRIPRALNLWLASMVGLDYDFREAKKQERREAKKENRDPLDDDELRVELENDILEKFGDYPSGTTAKILTVLRMRDDFDDFLASIKQLVGGTGSKYTRLLTTTKSAIK